MPALVALKQDAERSTALEVSIPTDAKNATFVSEQLQAFFLEHGTQPKVAYRTALCMEEIAADYLAHRSTRANSGTKTYMDIKAFRDAGRIEIILRNYDEPYNPPYNLTPYALGHLFLQYVERWTTGKTTGALWTEYFAEQTPGPSCGTIRNRSGPEPACNRSFLCFLFVGLRLFRPSAQ